MKMLEESCFYVCVYVKTDRMGLFKYVQFTVLQFYLNKVGKLPKNKK